MQNCLAGHIRSAGRGLESPAVARKELWIFAPSVVDIYLVMSTITWAQTTVREGMLIVECVTVITIGYNLYREGMLLVECVTVLNIWPIQVQSLQRRYALVECVTVLNIRPIQVQSLQRRYAYS